ncbi:aldo/keto reductase family protein [Sarocladium implicatum]|nr:aldo/keto reductase family protein [Sarocladium implicatum]
MSTSMMNFRDSPGHIPDKDLPGIHLGMPHIGLGTWHRDSATRPKPTPIRHPKHDLCSRRPRRETTGSICQIALDKGCKLIDTAKSYSTNYAVAAAVDLHCISRSAVFVTTKVDEEGATEQEARHLLLKSIHVAGGEKGYVDLLLIDSPQQSRLHGRKMMWIELEKLQREGKVKAIGVSNYTEERIMQMRLYATVWPPQVNQLIVSQGPSVV